MASARFSADIAAACDTARRYKSKASRLSVRLRRARAEFRAVAQRLVVTQRAVEKHINSIFAKLDLTVDDSVDRRVKAVLMFLNNSSTHEK